MKRDGLIVAIKQFFADNQANNKNPDSMIALITLAIQMLPTVTAGVESLIAFIMAQREILNQTSEWTPQMEADFRKALLESGSNAEFLTDEASDKKTAHGPIVAPAQNGEVLLPEIPHNTVTSLDPIV